MNKYMYAANQEAEKNYNNKFKDGGPFGAVIVKNNQIIATGKNNVLINNDPTAHAEISAIRDACKILNTHDLSGCQIYTTCFPCPMCLSAIIWANIKTIYYGNNKEDAANIGFKDDMIYSLFNNLYDNETVKFKQIDREETIKLFDKFKNIDDKIIY